MMAFKSLAAGQPNSTYTRMDLNDNEMQVSMKYNSGELIRSFTTKK